MDHQQQPDRRQLSGKHRTYREVRPAGAQTLRRPEQVLQPTAGDSVPSCQGGPEPAIDCNLPQSVTRHNCIKVVVVAERYGYLPNEEMTNMIHCDPMDDYGYPLNIYISNCSNCSRHQMLTWP